MTLLQTYDFEYRVGYTNPKLKFPQLAQGASYQFSLQGSDASYLVNVVWDYSYNDFCIEMYDDKGDLVQTRLRVAQNINLFYVEDGYHLEYSITEQAFLFWRLH